MKSAYMMDTHNLVLGNAGKRYILKVRDLAPDDKPREKLLAHGPQGLTNQELLAVLLGVGTKKEEVMAMSSRILKEYGEKSILSQRNVHVMADDLGIPSGKAAQIVACAELGRRFFQREGAGAKIIRTAKDVFEFTKDMRDLPKEHLRGIYLNAHYRVIHDEIISIGTLDASIIHPREVFKPALEYSAAGVVLVHNHPSGSTKPSDADREVTRQLSQAGKVLGIDLIDHVIITKSAFASISLE